MIALLSSSFVVLILFVLIVLFLHFVPLGLWVSALAAGVNVGIFTLVGMRLRRVVPSKIVLPLVKANKAGLDVNVDQLEAHYLADVDVGRNIGAQLMTDQAEADKNIAQAKAEERRAMAVAKEQEMRAYTQEMKAKVVEAQAEVPAALASALREGHLGVMDYYRMKNINADTAMREQIAGGEPLQGVDHPSEE